MKEWYINQPFFYKRLGLFSLALLVLVFVYLFQKYSYYHILIGDASQAHPYFIFIFNKFLRLTINDTACLLMIYAIFYDKKYVKVGGMIQLIEMFVILPIYFVIKLTVEGDSEISSPLLSQIHRLIINPVLMVLLMIGFYYQRKAALKRS